MKSIVGYVLNAKNLEILRGWLVQEHEKLYEDWFYLHSQDVELDVWLDQEHPDVFAAWILEAK